VPLTTEEYNKAKKDVTDVRTNLQSAEGKVETLIETLLTAHERTKEKAIADLSTEADKRETISVIEEHFRLKVDPALEKLKPLATTPPKTSYQLREEARRALLLAKVQY